MRKKLKKKKKKKKYLLFPEPSFKVIIRIARDIKRSRVRYASVVMYGIFKYAK